MNEDIPQHNSQVACFCYSWGKEQLVKHLRELRAERSKIGSGVIKRPRASFTTQERKIILGKTEGLCHICGGEIDTSSHWEVDHVLRRSLGGENKPDNYLAAHGTCNSYRWGHLPGEMEWILKIGVWARKQIESESKLGKEMLSAFFEYEHKREGRRKEHKLARQAAANTP